MVACFNNLSVTNIILYKTIQEPLLCYLSVSFSHPYNNLFCIYLNYIHSLD